MNVKLAEDKVRNLGLENMCMDEIVSLRDYYVELLNPKKPNENKDVFSKFLTLEKYILEKYTILKIKFDNLCKTNKIEKKEVCNIITNNNLNNSLFFENDIISLSHLIDIIEESYV